MSVIAMLDEAPVRRPQPMTLPEAQVIARRMRVAVRSFEGECVVVARRPRGARAHLGSGPTWERAFDVALRRLGR